MEPDPVAEYRLDFYARLAGALADGLGLARLRWVGTSMGGATGMHAAATTLRDRISHLVVNDIGPTLPQPAIDRILAYAGQPPAFDTVTELETWLRAAYKPYGWQSDEQWRRMAETSVRRLPDGRVTAHYDRPSSASSATTPATTNAGRAMTACACRCCCCAAPIPTCCCPTWRMR